MLQAGNPFPNFSLPGSQYPTRELQYPQDSSLRRAHRLQGGAPYPQSLLPIQREEGSAEPKQCGSYRDADLDRLMSAPEPDEIASMERFFNTHAR